MTRARDVANLIGSGNYSSTTFTATAGQTVFSIAHTQNFVQVFMNGLLLDLTADYTSNGSAVTLTSGAAVGDEIEVVAYNTFSVGDALNQAAADTRYVNATGDTMSGDLTIDTNTFHVDVADNRVGVGTTAPAQPLHVFKAGSQGGGMAPLIKVQNDTNNLTGDGSGIEFHGKYQGGEWGFGKIGGTNSGSNFGGALEFHTNTGTGSVSTGFTKKMTIDRNGYVTMPYQPAFSYLGSKSHVISTTGTVVMSSSNVWSASVNHALNRGSHFNASNGRFTAPVTGTYQFMFRCQMSNFNSGYLYSYFRINGSTKSYSQKSQATTWTAHLHYAIFEMVANDYVELAWTNNYVSGQIHYPEFSGYLLG